MASFPKKQILPAKFSMLQIVTRGFYRRCLIVFISVMAEVKVCAAAKTRSNCSLESPGLYKKLGDVDARVACLPEGSHVCEKHRYHLTKSDFCGGLPIWSEREHESIISCPKRLFPLLDALGGKFSSYKPSNKICKMCLERIDNDEDLKQHPLYHGPQKRKVQYMLLMNHSETV